MASRRKEGEPGADLSFDFPPTPAEQRPESTIEAELASVAPDEIDHRAARLAQTLPQSPPELLEEEGRAVGRPEEKQRIDARQVDPFIEEIDREERLDPAGVEVGQCRRAFGGRAVAPDGGRADPGRLEMSRHELRMPDVDAEAEGPHSGNVRHPIGGSRHDQPGPGVVRREDVRKPPNVVAPPAPPGNARQVEAVGETVVEKRNEPMLVDGVPEPELRRDASVEPVEDREPVAPLRGRRHSEQLERPDTFQQRLV